VKSCPSLRCSLHVSTQHPLVLHKHHKLISLPLPARLSTTANTSFDQPTHTNTRVLYIKRPHLLQSMMPHQTKPPTMSHSDWRLWCCCHPKVTPPPSSPRAHNNYSLDEFDPRNRMSMSKACRPLPPAPPSSPIGGCTNPTAPDRTIKFSEPMRSMPLRNGELVTGERGQERPPTILLPISPQAEYHRLPLRPKETSRGKGKQPMPTMIRHDTEPGQHWWQVGRGLMDRSGNDSGSQEDGWERGEHK
jgi:hypothetical protein